METLPKHIRIDGSKFLNEIENTLNYQISNDFSEDFKKKFGEHKKISTYLDRDEEERSFAMVCFDKSKWTNEKNIILKTFDIAPTRTRTIEVSADYDTNENDKTVRQVRKILFVEEQWQGGDTRVYITKGGRILDRFGTLKKFEYETIDPQDCSEIFKEIIEVIKYINKHDQKTQL